MPPREPALREAVQAEGEMVALPCLVDSEPVDADAIDLTVLDSIADTDAAEVDGDGDEDEGV